MLELWQGWPLKEELEGTNEEDLERLYKHGDIRSVWGPSSLYQQSS
jgi:hypothetical protein